jgi:hypothetical protein
VGGAIEDILKLVAEGRLTAEEAAPILDALSAAAKATDQAAKATSQAASAVKAAQSSATGDAGSGSAQSGPPRFARIEVRDGGKRVVDLRIPISLGRFALGRVPGLSAHHVADVERAVASGDRGPILDVQDEDGDGVRIVLE